MSNDFRAQLRADFDGFLAQQHADVDVENCLRIDLHCHDRNSDVPDELWGRILSLPETWLKPKKLMKRLEASGCTAFTVTNHNNARSCWELQDKGYDVLSAAEFTCFFPEYELFVHVLTYGFTQQQEKELNEIRGDIYDFLRYTTAHDIPVILPHPLYFYTRNDRVNLELFEKTAVLFQRFEVLNGQRDLWQSLLTLHWLQDLTPAKIREYARKHKLDPSEFGVDPDAPKVLTGGSDDHIGIFAGSCGSYAYVPNLRQRLATTKPSRLVLEAIREGRLIPFGNVSENEKLNIAMLDYISQVATNIEDPGLLRIMLHRGETFDKVACFIIANVMLELKSKKQTRRFFEFIHDTLNGKRPGRMVRWGMNKEYRFVLKYLESIADNAFAPQPQYVSAVSDAIHGLFNDLNALIAKRVRESKFANTQNLLSPELLLSPNTANSLEIPALVSSLFKSGGQSSPVKDLVGAISFPLLISAVLTATTVASTRALYANRPLLNRFAEHLGKCRHPRRALYLTDTLLDKNGVSNSLSGKLAEIRAHDMPVDFLICHDTAESDEHLHVVRPVASFSAEGYQDQLIRIPDMLEIFRIFYEGGYDRIVCSTEGPMVFVALMIKFKFNVPAFFFMHTDWMDFIRHKTDLDRHQADRIRRLMRALYHRFDGVFTLNNEHRDWLIDHEMQLPEEQVFLTAHHAQPRHPTAQAVSKVSLFADANDETPIVFIACRISREKGIFDLPEIMRGIRKELPNAKLVVAGTGPDLAELQQALPDALFLGWCDRERLASLYLGLDVFIFPSQFDTFGNVILEAFTHEMPVVSYNCKGPADIIEDGVSGFLGDTPEDLTEGCLKILTKPLLRNAMRKAVQQRAAQYQAEPIMREFMANLGLADDEEAISVQQEVVA